MLKISKTNKIKKAQERSLRRVPTERRPKREGISSVGRRGFTLIELIIYIAIVGGFLVLAISFAENIIKSQIKSSIYQEIQQNLRFAMEKISRSIRAGQNPSAVFSVADGILFQNGVPLTTSQVIVSNLEFIQISNTYQTNLTIKFNNQSNSNEYNASLDLGTTATNRSN